MKKIKGYTKEELYNLVGKYDYTTNITLRSNSESAMLYGKYLTVIFIYTQKEREEYEKKSQDSENKGVYGVVKLKKLLFDFNDYTTDLKIIEINSKDIIDISYFPYTESCNMFNCKDKRKINTIKVETNILHNGNDIIWIYAFLNKMKENDIALCPEDEIEYLAYKMILYPTELTEKERGRIYTCDNMMDKDVAYKYLNYKFHANKISNKEIKLLANLIVNRYMARLDILNKHLKELGTNVQKLKKENPQIANLLINRVQQFHEIRYNSIGKYPLFLDLKGFLHIYLRHVEEVQIGNSFSQKDNFQFKETDLKNVMNHIFHAINDDYQNYKNGKPNKEYRKTGAQSYYYNGDYYGIYINNDGSIASFFKYGPSENAKKSN